jgi:oligopeptide/dipeptide ABC transporter ATP-binding protein
MSASPLLDVRDLDVSYAGRGGAVRAVNGVSFAVHAGETVALVGESGCGKSSIAYALMRVMAPNASIGARSRVLFDGTDLLALEERKMRELRGHRISMIFQEPASALNPVMKVGAQVAEVARLHGERSRLAAWERAVAMLDRTGIANALQRAHSYPHELSGGMRQRVLIAMALLMRPSLVIADEPTSALDVTVQAQVLDVLRDLQRETGMAILLITHDFGVVAQMADDVAVMYAGQVVERGPAGDLLRSPQHPYTEALLRSVPVLGMNKDQPLEVIPGTVPSPLGWPPGCRFEARCPHAFARCRQAAPPLVPVSGNREAACWLRDGEAASQAMTVREGPS